jgi:hypothetical protein
VSQAASSIARRKEGLSREVYPEQDLDNGVVGWEGQNDPENPRYVQQHKILISSQPVARNYPSSRKWILLGFVSGITFIRYVI